MLNSGIRNLPIQNRLLIDALAIWKAGVDAVRADHVVADQIRIEGNTLLVADNEYRLHPRGKLVVIGAGKASAAMAAGFSKVITRSTSQNDLVGWINVPQLPDSRHLPIPGIDSRIHVCLARPWGMNEPTVEAVQGTNQILSLLKLARPIDTVVCLISGGGSALLCSPVDGVTLDEKIGVTRFLSRSGAKIEELNAVRRSISKVKAGGLVNHCNAVQIVSLIISDVLGDPIETIASGPTCVSSPVDFELALETLHRFDPKRQLVPKSIFRSIEESARGQKNKSGLVRSLLPTPKRTVDNIVLANNATAVDAAGTEAVERGYAYWMESSRLSEGDAELLGRKLARQCVQLQNNPQIQCLITGGEPTVHLPKENCGRGGRNQQLVLAALDELRRLQIDSSILKRIVLLSAGTDGEDGPTDAAGAWIDAGVIDKANSLQLCTEDFLKRCDAYTFFDYTQSLIKTGLTNTNVCDLRVALFAPE